MNPSRRTCHSASLFKNSCLSVLVAIALGANARAQQPAQATRYEVPAGDLTQVVNQISSSSGVQIVYDIELLRGKRAAEVRGAMTLERALDRALNGSGLSWERVNATTVSIQKKVEPKRSVRRPPHTSEQKSTERGGEPEDLEQVVVVGSRLGTSPVESAMPIKLITREDIDRSGAGNIAQALSYLSEISLSSTGDREIGVGTGVGDGGNTNSTTVQMRGLPRGTTLVLINGRRAGDSAMFSMTGQFDLSTIPLSLVERIEVLPAGSSAVYGGDGLAGVINVVLRRDASGLELRVRKTVADGYDRDAVSALWGEAWSRGSVTVAASWNRNSPLFASERRISADQDFRRFGGRDLRSGTGEPPAVYSLAGCPAPPALCYIPIADRAPLPGLDYPVATVPLGQDGRGLTPADFLATQGEVVTNSRARHLISPETSRGITLSGRVELLPTLEAFSELTYTKRSVPAYQVPFWIDGQNGNLAGRLEADHPFNPFGVPIGVTYYQRDTGVYTAFSQEHVRGLVGVRGQLGRFEWEVTGMQSRDKAGASGAVGYSDAAAVAAALAITDPELALNPFITNGSSIASQERLWSLLNTSLAHDTASRGDVWTGYIRGPLFQLPAGQVQGLLGLEHQRQEIRVDSNSASLVTKHVNGASESKAAFAEVRVPILSARQGSSHERIAMTGATRLESSDRFKEKTQTKTVGLEVRPTNSLLLRSTYSTAFRPLLAYSAVQDAQPADHYISDPLFDGQFYRVPGISTGGVPPDLGPETSTTITLGALYRPSADWSLSLTHWDMKFRDRIEFVDSQTLVDNEEHFRERVMRDPVTGLVSYIDGRQINISRYDSAGVDIAADAVFQTGIGYITSGLSATYTYKHETQLTDTSPLIENIAVRRSDGWAPRWKVVPRIGWQPRDGIHALLVGRYISKYMDSTALVTGPNRGTFPVLGDFWMFDLNADLDMRRLLRQGSMFGGFRLTLGATNLLNKQPEFCMGCGINGYDASIYDVVGRTYYAELRWSL